jgi:hypothetical protein
MYLWRKAMAGLVRAAALMVLVGTAGCGSEKSTEPDAGSPPLGQAVPDFSLLDVNPRSATHNTQISPRSYLGTVTAWFFGLGHV